MRDAADPNEQSIALLQQEQRISLLFLSQLLHTLHVLSFDPVMIVDPS